jgi:hypothetical protein
MALGLGIRRTCGGGGTRTSRLGGGAPAAAWWRERDALSARARSRVLGCRFNSIFPTLTNVDSKISNTGSNLPNSRVVEKHPATIFTKGLRGFYEWVEHELLVKLLSFMAR